MDASVVRSRRARCLPGSRASTSLTTTLLHSVAQTKSSDQLASLYQVLHRTTSNEPLRIVQQTRGQKGFEAWHATVRRYDQRNMSDKNSAHAALISNISEKDRAHQGHPADKEKLHQRPTAFVWTKPLPQKRPGVW